MATKINALLYAQDAANKEQKPYVIQQQKNGQWLFAPADKHSNTTNCKTVTIKPNK